MFPFHTSVKYFCTPGFDNTFFCLPSIRQSSMLVPRWSTALSTMPESRPSAVEARFKRSEAMISQWPAAARRSTKRTFSFTEAKHRARDRRTAVARGAAEYSTSSSRARLEFSLPHTIRSYTNCKVVNTKQHETSNTESITTVDQKTSETAKIVHFFLSLITQKVEMTFYGNPEYIVRSNYKKSWQYLWCY